MDLELVRTFLLVYERRSFTGAARVLGIPTSSVSRAVQRLEDELGHPLFERTTRRTEPTAAGRAWVEPARAALGHLERGREQLAELSGAAVGEIRLTTFTNLDDGFLAATLAQFSRQHPGIRVAVFLQNRKVDLLAEGYDLALRGELEPPRDLVSHELGRYHAWLVASPRYLARRGAPRRPADLTQHDCVASRGRPDSGRWRLIGPGGVVEEVQVSGPVAADDLQFGRQLVRAGAGIGTQIFSPGQRPRLDPRLRRVLPRYVVGGPNLYLVLPRAGEPPLRVRLLRDHLLAAYRVRRGS